MARYVFAVASSISGVLTRVPCHPIDTVKARMQTQTWVVSHSETKGSVKYSNFAQGLSSVWKAEGLKGLYRGFGPTALGSLPASCLYFTTYEVTKSTLHENTSSNGATESSFYVHSIAGLVAEIISCVLWVPVDVIKERMQIQQVPISSNVQQLKQVHGDRFYGSGLDAVRSIFRTEGVKGFYRGYGATVLSFGPFSAIYFTVYEQLKRALESAWMPTRAKGDSYVTTVPMGFLFGAGALAGGSASFITNPLDLVKLRLQVQRQIIATANEGVGESQYHYKNMLDGLIKLGRHEGAAGMFRGVGARVAFHAPATALSMALFEKLKVYTYSL